MGRGSIRQPTSSGHAYGGHDRRERRRKNEGRRRRNICANEITMRVVECMSALSRRDELHRRWLEVSVLQLFAASVSWKQLF